MKPMTLRELADLGHLVGHSATDITPTASGARFTVGCSCGMRTTTRRTEADCLEAIIFHLKKEVAAYAASGRPLPDIPLPGARRDTPPAAQPPQKSQTPGLRSVS